MAVSDVGAEQEAELPSLAGLPESVLLHIVHACMHDGCGSVFWTLSQVSLQLAAVAAQVGRGTPMCPFSSLACMHAARHVGGWLLHCARHRRHLAHQAMHRMHPCLHRPLLASHT